MNEVLKAEMETQWLKEAAIHEAAHAVICESLGGRAFANVWRNESGNPEEKAFCGNCQIYSPAYLADNCDFWVSLAGIAAEEIADELNEGNDDFICMALWDRLEADDGISASDWEGIGDIDAIENGQLPKMIAMLRAEWEAVTGLADAIIADVMETA